MENDDGTQVRTPSALCPASHLDTVQESKTNGAAVCAIVRCCPSRPSAGVAHPCIQYYRSELQIQTTDPDNPTLQIRRRHEAPTEYCTVCRVCWGLRMRDTTGVDQAEQADQCSSGMLA